MDQPGVPSQSGRKAAGQQRPAISIKGLTKTYASGFQALAGIDLDIHAGEIFALLGPNGGIRPAGTAWHF